MIGTISAVSVHNIVLGAEAGDCAFTIFASG